MQPAMGNGGIILRKLRGLSSPIKLTLVSCQSPYSYVRVPCVRQWAPMMPDRKWEVGGVRLQPEKLTRQEPCTHEVRDVSRWW